MGWTYNTLNPDAETRAPIIAAVGITFTALSLAVVLLRLYVRLKIVKKASLDDWLIVFTWFMSFGFFFVTVLQSKWGLGLVHLSDMPDENIFTFGVLQYAGAPFYITSVLGFKLSLLASFYRIAVERPHKIAIIGMTVATTGFHFSFLMGQLFLCTPVNKQWDGSVVGGKCLDAVPFYTTMASIIIVFDVIIMLLPFPVLMKIKLPQKKKIVLCLLFGLGTFITVIQIIRIRTIKSLQNYLDSSDLIMWSMVENNLGIITASIPTLYPLVATWRDKTDSGRATSYALQSKPTGYGQKSLRPNRSEHLNLESLDPDTGGETFDKRHGHSTIIRGHGANGDRVRADDSSEELIDSPRRPNGIKATTVVTVTRGDYKNQVPSE